MHRFTSLTWEDKDERGIGLLRTKIASDDPGQNLYLAVLQIERNTELPDAMIRATFGNVTQREISIAELERVNQTLRGWAGKMELYLGCMSSLVGTIVWHFVFVPRKPFTEHAMEIAQQLFEALGARSERWFRTLRIYNSFRASEQEEWMSLEELLLKKYRPAGLVLD